MVAPRSGFEPLTTALTVRHSTIELPRNVVFSDVPPSFTIFTPCFLILVRLGVSVVIALRTLFVIFAN